MAAKRVLVTGATGFIGRWAVASLLARGYEVHVATSRAVSGANGLPAEIADAWLHEANLLLPGICVALVDEVRPSHLLHFAWNVVPGVYWTTPDNFRWVAASIQLLQAFERVGGHRAVMAGSCAEYDWARASVCHEETTPLAVDGSALATPYATCKVALQKMLAAYGRQARISTAWGRIFFHYGPHEHRDRLVSSVICNLLAGQDAACTHGRQIRNFIHVADVGDAFAALMESDVQGPVNIGSDQRFSLAEMLTLIGDEVGRADLLKLGARPAPLNEPAVLVPDVGRLYGEVGWRPRFTLEAGLSETIDWWRRQPTIV